jgi:hypothetical protein
LNAMPFRISPSGVMISISHDLISRKSENALSPTRSTPCPLMSKVSTTLNVVFGIFSTNDEAEAAPKRVHLGCMPRQALDEIGCRFQGDVVVSRIADQPSGRSASSTILGSRKMISSSAATFASEAGNVSPV